MLRHYEDPIALQQEVLRDILKINRSTAFGRDHDFYAIIKDPASFAQKVPVRTYEEHLPYLKRILEGNQRILTDEAPQWIATTSGTTGSTKYLPLSQSAIRDIHLKGSWMSLACLYEKDED
ncbi:MAG: GH3 auxin-responsive promoter family protein, partial [Bacteroidota bacterium]